MITDIYVIFFLPHRSIESIGDVYSMFPMLLCGKILQIREWWRYNEFNVCFDIFHCPPSFIMVLTKEPLLSIDSPD